MDAGGWALVAAVVLLAFAVGVLSGVVLAQRRRLEELARPEPDELPTAVVPQQPSAQDVEFLITTVGQAEEEPAPVANQLVLSATLGEPLVKAAAWAHGVRRALSPESRNRIRFHMRQEVRRTRKERRREMRVAWREMKRQDQAPRDAA